MSVEYNSEKNEYYIVCDICGRIFETTSARAGVSIMQTRAEKEGWSGAGIGLKNFQLTENSTCLLYNKHKCPFCKESVEDIDEEWAVRHKTSGDK